MFTMTKLEMTYEIQAALFPEGSNMSGRVAQKNIRKMERMRKEVLMSLHEKAVKVLRQREAV